MHHTAAIDASLSRQEKYDLLVEQIKALVSGENDLIANLANVSALIKESLGFFWVGFYRLKGEELILGPFQGPIACSRIPVSKGVCGATVRKGATTLVSDVDAFPGHIACSSHSKSEIVVPLIAQNEVQLLLDIDSDQLNDFDQVDQRYLETVVQIIQQQHFS